MAASANILNGNGNTFGSLVRDVLSNMHVGMLLPMSTIIAPFFDTQKSGKGQLPGSSLGLMANVMAYNAVASALQTLAGGLEAVLAELLFISGKFWYYKFLINPQNFRLSNNKLQTVEETSDITIINTYRNASPTLNISGVSGCTMNRFLMDLVAKHNIDPSGDSLFPTKMSGAVIRYPKLSTAFLKFRQLEKFYNQTNSDVIFVYDLDLYVGKLTSFNFNMDANNPWVINYDMTLRLYPDLTLHTFSIYDYKPFFSALLERYGSTFASDFEGKSKAQAN